jgi:hypothetical protein
MRHHHHLRLTAIALGILSASSTYASCGSTACSINTNWDEHSASKPGLSMDLRYSYSQADQLRSGSNKITANPTDPALVAGSEVENLRTINKIITAGIDYTHDEHWGVALNIPYISREHSHSLADTNPALVGTDSFSANSLGDIKAVGRYRWSHGESADAGMGVKFGLKLNTGKSDFLLASGTLPNEVSLQPGNGSTDLILGLFWQQANPASSLSWFAQGMVQSAIQNKTEYKPGNQINLDAGTRYAFSKDLSGLLQVNAQWNAADSGTSAALTSTGEASSGGNSVSLTPGISYAIATDTNVYGLVQVPLYQYVNGEQLTANYSGTIGINHRF